MQYNPHVSRKIFRNFLCYYSVTSAYIPPKLRRKKGALDNTQCTLRLCRHTMRLYATGYYCATQDIDLSEKN